MISGTDPTRCEARVMVARSLGLNCVATDSRLPPTLQLLHGPCVVTANRTTMLSDVSYLVKRTLSAFTKERTPRLAPARKVVQSDGVSSGRSPQKSLSLSLLKRLLRRLLRGLLRRPSRRDAREALKRRPIRR